MVSHVNGTNTSSTSLHKRWRILLMEQKGQSKWSLDIVEIVLSHDTTGCLFSMQVMAKQQPPSWTGHYVVFCGVDTFYPPEDDLKAEVVSNRRCIGAMCSWAWDFHWLVSSTQPVLGGGFTELKSSSRRHKMNGDAGVSLQDRQVVQTGLVTWKDLSASQKMCSLSVNGDKLMVFRVDRRSRSSV